MPGGCGVAGPLRIATAAQPGSLPPLGFNDTSGRVVVALSPRLTHVHARRGQNTKPETTRRSARSAQAGTVWLGPEARAVCPCRHTMSFPCARHRRLSARSRGTAAAPCRSRWPLRRPCLGARISFAAAKQVRQCVCRAVSHSYRIAVASFGRCHNWSPFL